MTRSEKTATPAEAVTVVMPAVGGVAVFSLVLCLVGGIAWGPFGAYGFYGTILGLGMLIVYILLNLALIMFYRREHPSEFNPIRHGVLPIVASALMLLPIGGLLYPVPDFPNRAVPYIMVAWIIAGFVYLAVVVNRRPDILDAMGRAIGEDAEPAEPAVRADTSPA